MIDVFLVPDIITRDQAQMCRVVWRGQTIRDIVDPLNWESPAVWCDGTQVGEDQWDRPLQKGSALAVASVPGITTAMVVTAIVTAIISAALSFAINRLWPPDKPPESQDDNTSPSYGWDGMQTEWGSGAPIAMVWGEWDVPGQVIHSEVNPGKYGNDILTVELVLSEGRCDSIDGLVNGPLYSASAGESGVLGDISALLPGSPVSTSKWNGAFPGNLRANGTLLDGDVAEVSVRMGENYQTAMPLTAETKALISVREDLSVDRAKASATLANDQAANLWINIRFSQGLFRTNSSGGTLMIELEFSVLFFAPDGSSRPVGMFRVATPQVTTGDPRASQRQGFTHSEKIQIPSGTAFPLQVEVTRGLVFDLGAQKGRDPDQNDTTFAHFAAVQYSTLIGMTHPGLTRIAIRMAASERTSGSRPNFRVRGRYRRVKIYHPDHGLSLLRYWDLPAVGDPYRIYEFPPGNNNALVCLDFLISPEGLGNLIGEDKVDFKSFFQWSLICDQMKIDATYQEPVYRCEYSLDTVKKAWDTVLEIMRSGGASPVWRGNKLGVAHTYRDAITTVPGHELPARATYDNTAQRWFVHHKQVFSSANIAGYECTFSNPRYRDTVTDVSFMDRRKNYERVSVPVDDPHEASIQNHPSTQVDPVGIRKGRMSLPGVVRLEQAFWMGRFQHNVNRLSRTTVKFKAGLDAIMMEPGDIIGVQSDATKPLGRDSFGAASTVEAWDFALVIDRELTIPANEQWQVFAFVSAVMGEDPTEVQEFLIPPLPTEQVFAAGDPIPCADPLATANIKPAEWKVGTPVAYGPRDSAVTSYIIRGIELDKDFVRTITAVEWHPEFFDVDMADLLSSFNTDEGLDLSPSTFGDTGFGAMPYDLVSFRTSAEPETIQVFATAELNRKVVSWAIPSGSYGMRGRCFYRAVTGDWILLGESATGNIETSALRSLGCYDLAVAIEDAQGVFPNPVAIPFAEAIFVDEFPRDRSPAVEGVRGSSKAETVLIDWDRVAHAEQKWYEVRRGVPGGFTGARRIAIELDSQHEHRPSNAAKRYWISSILGNNMRGKPGQLDLLTLGVLDEPLIAGYPHYYANSYVFTNPGGAPTGTEATTNLLEYAADAGRTDFPGRHWGLAPRQTQGEILIEGIPCAGLKLRFAVVCAWHWHEDVKPSELKFSAAHGEAVWRTPWGREPSPGAPGVLLDLPVSEFDPAGSGSRAGMLVRDLPDTWTARGPIGQLGEHATCSVEVRWGIGATPAASVWTNWEIYTRPEVRVFWGLKPDWFEVRVRMRRRSDRYDLRLDSLNVALYGPIT